MTHVLLLLIAVVLGVAAYFPGSRLTLDRSIDTMFADRDPLLPPYHHLKRTFGGNDMILCVYDDPELLDHLRQLEQDETDDEVLQLIHRVLSRR